MIDIACEKLYPLRQIAALLHTHPETVRQWSVRGKQGHRLETVAIGNRRETSIEAVNRFLEVVSSHPLRKPPIGNLVVARSVRDRNRAIREAKRTCEASGA